MSSIPPPPRRVPTLTEVVAAPEPVAPAAVQAPGDAAAAAGSDEQLVQRVLEDVQRQIELMLEYRVREALSPALARLTDALVRETRAELASTLRDMVARAVAQELSRHRGR